ncbi:integrase/recombinase, partial [mine drainage metagenome]
MTPERGGRRPRDDTYRAKALADPRVRSWWQSQRLGSHITADVNLRQLWAFLIEAKLDPHQLVALAKDEPEKLQEIIVEYADQLVNRGRLASYIAKTFVGVKSWLRFNGVEFHRFPKLKVLQGQSLSKERTPTPAELHRLLGVLDPRGRMIALLMAHAGLRPGVLGSMDGTDGLTLGDLPELTLKGEPAFKRIPFLIVVAGTHSKNRLDYVTFGTQELAEAVLAYLADRQSRGEKLTPASPLVNLSAFASANYNHARVKSDFITTTVITRGLRNAIAKVLPKGVEWRPYVLRAYCSTQLWAAGNHGKIDRDAREAILGHDLGVSGRYNLSKRLHPEMVEELRAAYARCEGYLSTVPTRDDAQGA